MKTCIFCRCSLNSSNRAREHVFPRWLLDEWDLYSNLVMPTHFSETQAVLSTRSHILGQFLAGSICGACNNGWMSRLEVEAKDLILELASGKRRILDLSDSEATILARWTAKTAFVLHTSSNWRRVVPSEHIVPFDQPQLVLPKGVLVLGHTYKSSCSCSWAQSTGWLGLTNDSLTPTEESELRASGYKIGIKIGGLYLGIFRIVHNRAKPLLKPRRHVALYPRVRGTAVAWDANDHAWPSHDLKRFHTFFHTVALKYD